MLGLIGFLREVMNSRTFSIEENKLAFSFRQCCGLGLTQQ